jgi:hypothetical protein
MTLPELLELFASKILFDFLEDIRHARSSRPPRRCRFLIPGLGPKDRRCVFASPLFLAAPIPAGAGAKPRVT